MKFALYIVYYGERRDGALQAPVEDLCLTSENPKYSQKFQLS